MFTPIDIKEVLSKLVAMRTLSDDTAENERGLDYIEGFLVRNGLHSQRFVIEGHGALVATTQPDQKNPAVMLYAHLDVLPGPDKVFTLRTVEDKMYGRGVFDMKFAIAAYMKLVEDLGAEIGSYDFGIMITTDEEYGGIDGINSVPHLLKMGYSANVCIIPDGGDDWHLERLAKGLWRFTLVADGKNAHGARPWEGENAAFKLMDCLHDIRELFRQQQPETDTLNVGILKGGEAFNQIPDKMSAAVEVRFASNEGVERITKAVKTIVSEHNLSMVERAFNQPTTQNVTHPLCRAFQASILRITGTSPDTCISYGQSDAMYFNGAGIPCVVVRPPGGGAHGEEWLSYQGLQQLPIVLKDYLQTTAMIKPVSIERSLVINNN